MPGVEIVADGLGSTFADATAVEMDVSESVMRVVSGDRKKSVEQS